MEKYLINLKKTCRLKAVWMYQELKNYFSGSRGVRRHLACDDELRVLQTHRRLGSLRTLVKVALPHGHHIKHQSAVIHTL